MQTPVEFEVTDFVPSPFVVTEATKLPPTDALEGRLLMVGVVGVRLGPPVVTVKLVVPVEPE